MSEAVDRPAMRLTVGARLGLAGAALLVACAALVLFWPMAFTGPDTVVHACGSAAAPAAGAAEPCPTMTGQRRLQAMLLVAGAAIVAITCYSVFGSEPLRGDDPAEVEAAEVEAVDVPDSAGTTGDSAISRS